jgi:hypothetical protein
MADEQYKWLDRDAAERLLRGEPLEFVDAETRDQADRLAEALGVLAAEPPLSSAELPGEADALAAFRKARTCRGGEQAVLGDHDRRHSETSSDVGVICLGRPAAGRRAPSRWGRPLRFGLAAALAVGMISGVTTVATTGLLPFGGDDPEPAASVPGDAPRRPLISPSPDTTRQGRPDDPRPDGNTGDGPASQGSPDSRDGTPGDGSTAPGAGSDDTRHEVGSQEWWNGVTSACRDLRTGKSLDSDRRRVLEEAAQGAGRVKKYCKGVLKQSEGRVGAGSEKKAKQEKKDDEGADGEDGNDDRGNNGQGNDGRGNSGHGDDEGDDSHIRSSGDNGGHRAGVLPMPARPVLTLAPPVGAPDRTTAHSR